MRRARSRLATGRGTSRIVGGRGTRRLRPVLAGILAAIIVLLAGIWLGGHPSSLPSLLRGSVFERGRKEAVTEQALNILDSRFFRPIDRAKLVDLGLAAIVEGLDDRYSHYIDPSSYKEQQRESDEQDVGIGIGIASDPDGLRVTSVLEDSPAERAGLKRGDVIVKVGSTSLAGRDEAFAADLIRGPAGTTVTLTVLRDGTRHEVQAKRAKTTVPVASERMLGYNGVRIGYLRLTTFADGSGEEMRTAGEAVLRERAQALVLDLRGNGGGLIREAITVASIFLARGEIMSAEERGQLRRVYRAHGDAIAPRMPLVVLVDHGTASAAEIVTAALQDHHRAKVIGTQTYGKGAFQNTLPLNNGGALDISIGEFFTPDGRNLAEDGGHGAGITPNIKASDNPDTPEDEALTVAERTVSAEVTAR